MIFPIHTAQTGQARELIASFISHLLNENRALPIVHKASIVKFHSAHTS
jgi:hypothetical protein